MSTHKPTHTEAAPALFDLATARIVVLYDRTRNFTLHCRRITNRDWEEYFAGIVIVAEQDGKQRINTIDFASPRVVLAESVLHNAEGYKVEGGASLTELSGWQRKIPLAHRQRLGESLSDVRASEPEEDAEFTIYPEGEVVFLDATFSALKQLDEEGAERLSMVKLYGLKHILETPTERQHKRYAAESSRSTVVGGSRTGKTIYRTSYPLLAALYDELVISVEGYSVNGRDIANDRDAIVHSMDMLHKVMAAQQLFQPQDTSSLAVSGDEEGGEE